MGSVQRRIWKRRFIFFYIFVKSSVCSSVMKLGTTRYFPLPFVKAQLILLTKHCSHQTVLKSNHLQ